MNGYARLLGPTDGIDGHTDEAIQSLITRFVDGVRDAGEHGVTRTLGVRDPDERVWGCRCTVLLRPAGKQWIGPISRSWPVWIPSGG